MKKIILPAFLALCVISACRNVPSNPGNKDTTVVADSTLISAIDGLVLKGPISPVERPGIPNTAPLANAPISISEDNTAQKPISIVSDSVGKFYVHVSPGTYTITPNSFPNMNPAGYPRPGQPATVVVPANTVVNDTLNYDTGIR
jgi:hypothetical protein